jgi:hypothetical protein
MDARCCLLCRLKTTVVPEKDRCEVCPATVCAFFSSGLFLTSTGGRAPGESDFDHYCCWTVLCFPLKFPLCFPCLLGAGCNHLVNKCRGQMAEPLNYLF